MAFKSLDVDTVDLGGLKGKELDSWRDSISQSIQPFKAMRAFKTESANEQVSAVMTLKDGDMVAYNLPGIARRIEGGSVGDACFFDLHRGTSSETGEGVLLGGGDAGRVGTDAGMPISPIIDLIAPTSSLSIGIRFRNNSSDEMQYAGFLDFIALL